MKCLRYIWVEYYLFQGFSLSHHLQEDQMLKYKHHVNKLHREILQGQSVHSRKIRHQDRIVTEFRRKVLEEKGRVKRLTSESTQVRRVFSHWNKVLDSLLL